VFERYTERGRRAIFFARYEAGSFGSDCIEPEHLLLGILREDKTICDLLGGVTGAEHIRKQIEARSDPSRPQTSTTVDMAVSPQLNRVLAYGAGESERLNHRHIGTLHLALGILSQRESFAASCLNQAGIDAEKLMAVCEADPLPFVRAPISLFKPLCDLAEDEANMLNRLPGPEHMLLALLRSEHSLAVTILKEKGFTLEGLREEIRRRYTPQL
jgi:ATP-dependent Clp protease ATP-binding subunit ClpA